MRSKLTTLALAGTLVGGGCASKKPEPIFQGIITAESFFPRVGWSTEDRYTTVVKLLSGEEIGVVNYDDNARIFDLKYNVGDTVSIQKYRQFEAYRIIELKREKGDTSQ